MAKADKVSFEKCPKCELRPATAGRNRWCAECNNAYWRDYEATRGERAIARGFIMGMEAMRRASVEHFQQFPFAHFAGAEVSKMLGTIPAPRYETRSPEQTLASNGVGDQEAQASK